MSLGAAFGSSFGVALGVALGGSVLAVGACAAGGALLGLALARLLAPPPSRGPTPS